MQLERLRELEKEKLITLRKHPIHDVWIANYSTQCQIDRAWTRETVQCRGLILNDQRVLARPFKKFFNYGELQGLRNKLWDLYHVHYSEIFTMPFRAYEKMDGSLGILFRLPNGKWEWATRGSFESEQAAKARLIWKEKYSHLEDKLDPQCTYLFEILCEESKVVVRYNFEELVFLCKINIQTSEESFDDVPSDWFTRPEIYDLSNIEQAEFAVNDYENFEGFVLDFGGGFRCKIKSEDYCRLHKIVTEVTPRRVFEVMRHGKDMSKWLDGVPDEFYNEIITISNQIKSKFKAIEIYAHNNFEHYKNISSRKSFAQQIDNVEHKGLLFKLFDGKDITEDIWRILDKEY